MFSLQSKSVANNSFPIVIHRPHLNVGEAFHELGSECNCASFQTGSSSYFVYCEELVGVQAKERPYPGSIPETTQFPFFIRGHTDFNVSTVLQLYIYMGNTNIYWVLKVYVRLKGRS